MKDVRYMQEPLPRAAAATPAISRPFLAGAAAALPCRGIIQAVNFHTYGGQGIDMHRQNDVHLPVR